MIERKSIKKQYKHCWLTQFLKITENYSLFYYIEKNIDTLNLNKKKVKIILVNSTYLIKEYYILFDIKFGVKLWHTSRQGHNFSRVGRKNWRNEEYNKQLGI